MESVIQDLVSGGGGAKKHAYVLPAIEKLIINNDLDQDKNRSEGKEGSMGMDAVTAMLAAERGRGNCGDGMGFGGGGIMGLFALLALMRGGNGFGFGGDNGAGAGAFSAQLNGMEQRISSIQTQNDFNAVQSQLTSIATNMGMTQDAIMAAISQSKDVTQAGIAITNSNIKDSQYATNLAIGTLGRETTSQFAQVNASISQAKYELANQITAGNTAILTKIDTNRISQLEAELAETRHTSRSRDVEVNVTQNVVQAQAQNQTQSQINSLITAVNGLVAHNQYQQATNRVYNTGSGTIMGSATNAATQNG